ncbi:hypothetical protein GEMRC1_009051 [Eukaryota sp. GEM-RC1]
MNVMENRIQEARILDSRKNGTTIEVIGRGRTYLVELEQKHCDCGVWQTEAIPCSHAAKALMSENVKPLEFVDSCFETRTQSKIYDCWVAT